MSMEYLRIYYIVLAKRGDRVVVLDTEVKNRNTRNNHERKT